LQLVESSDVPESFLSSQGHKPFESESSKIFSSRVRVVVMTWLSRVRIESQKLSSHFGHWFASSSQYRVILNFTFFLLHFLCYEMAPNIIKLRPIS